MPHIRQLLVANRSRGDALVSIEAMKMVTLLQAESDGVVEHVHVRPGAIVAAKDLLLSLKLVAPAVAVTS